MLNIRLEKCRVCSETIYFNCLECLQCKLTGHKKCLQRIYVKCPNKLMPPRLKVFGLEISNENQISEVLSCCIMEIEKRPIHQLKGIYKQDGTASIIENLCLSFEFGSHLIDLCQISPHNLAGVVKQYLAQISTPIFSPSLQNELITIGREWPVRKVPYTQTGITILIFELRRLIGCLTTTNRNNLAYLFYHFKRIVDRENITEMSANALGVVFAPIIFQKESHENLEAITGLARIDSEINSSGENDINRIILEDNDQNNLIQSKNDSSDTKIETNFVANGEDHRADCSPGIIDDVVRRKFFNPNPLQTFSMQTVNNQFIENFHHHHHCSNHQSYNVFKNSKIKHSSTTNNNNNRGVKILLDVTVKIRIIELMIIYVNDLFSDWI
ncbi:soluble guanylyl cyclase beta subunit [Sarcoptes scabiei]|nr:soluble guanylyl cyclase beta subunit [Sarcoptes scabiei]